MNRDGSKNGFVARLLPWRWTLFTLAIVLGIVAWPMSERLTLDRRLESMFRADDPNLIAYQDLKSAFGGNAVAMVVYRDVDAFSRAGLDRNEQLGNRIRELAGVQGILSSAVLNRAIEILRPLGSSNADGVPALANRDDKFAQQFDAIFAGYTHTTKHDYLSVVAMLSPEHDALTIAGLRDVVQSLRDEGREAVLVGEPVLLHDGFNLIERDSARLAVWTIVLLSIVLLVSLRDMRFVALAALVIFWTVITTRAVAVALSIQLSIVSSILTAIVTVIAVASVLHLGVRYRTARRRGATGVEATRVTLRSLAVPIFWTCATDAAGFAALMFSRIRPVQDFGVMIAIASTAVLVSILLLAPAIMSITFRDTPISSSPSRVGPHIRRGCIQLANWFVARRKLVTIASLVALCVLLLGVSRLETETSFLNNFRPESEIAQAYDLVEREFGGAGVWDVVINAPDSISKQNLDDVRALQGELQSIDVDGVRLTKVLSIADVELALSQLPLLSFAPVDARLAGMRLAMPVISDALLTPANTISPRRLRIMLRSNEQLPAEIKNRLIERVQSVVRDHVPLVVQESNSKTTAIVTGYYVLIATWIRQLVDDQWRCLAASGILVWLLLAIAFRSFWLATAALIPNLLPVFLVLAGFGLLGDKINMGAAMIAAVSIGLSIDSSVHYLAGYQHRRSRGHNADSSAAHAAGAISRPVIAATIALVIGFSVLGTSEFVPTATFGVLIAATLTVSTLVNLTLLPALVRLVDRHER